MRSGGVVDFEAVLAGVACTADYNGESGSFGVEELEAVESHRGEVDAHHRGENALGVGALDGELAVSVAEVGDADVESFGAVDNPLYVLGYVRGVDHEEIAVGAYLIDKEVVYGASVGVGHHSVENLSVGDSADVVGEDAVDEALGVGAFDEEFAHVADVENADGSADGGVFGIEARGVFDGHVETGKGRHFRAESGVAAVEAGFFYSGVFHASVVGSIGVV